MQSSTYIPQIPLSIYNPQEFQGRSWHEISEKEEADQKISENSLLDQNLDTLEKYYFPGVGVVGSEIPEYPFSPKYSEYRRMVTKRELDIELDNMKSKKTETLSGAGCLFYSIDERGRLWILVERKHSKFGGDRPILYPLGGEFGTEDDCAFSCAKRNVEKLTCDQLSMNGTEELCDSSVKTKYFIYFREIQKDDYVGYSDQVSWYLYSPTITSGMHQTLIPILRILVKRQIQVKESLSREGPNW